jgi:hypothetical protein
MSDKIIKEGGYQPTKDPPARPPAVAIKPAASPAPAARPQNTDK